MTRLTSQADAAEPGVHALVIGVGKYPFMGRGSADTPTWRQQFGDLDSPSLSAAVLAEWLRTSMRLSTLPLKSLDVLASTPTECVAFDGALTQVEEPTMANIQAAAARWFDAANAHPENLSVFYFCGHGFAVGDVRTLLTQDFGSDEHDPFIHAIDPDGLVAGMLRCEANQQLFIFDACSTQNYEVSEEFGQVKARPLIAGKKHSRLQIVTRSVISTTQLGAEAFGQTAPPKPSVFMEAFLQAVQGAGAKQDDVAAWVVEPTSLKLGTDLLMKRILQREEQCLSFGTADSADFPLHELSVDPIVPIMVVCKPAHHLASSILRCSSGESRATPSTQPWHLDLPMGNYVFQAKNIQTGLVKSSQQSQNRPPRLVVPILC